MKYQMNCEIICELEPDKRRSAVQVRISPQHLPDFYEQNMYAPE